MYTLTQQEGGGVRVCVYMLEYVCVLACVCVCVFASVFMLECVCAKCLTYIFKFDAFWGLLTPV